MVIIKYALDRSFTRFNTNNDTALERGSFPFNYTLLVDTQLWSTITDREHIYKVASGVTVPYHTTANFVDFVVTDKPSICSIPPP